MHNIEQVTQDIFGTNSSPTTLTASFVASSTMFAQYYKKCSLDVRYNPGANNAYSQILLEYSQDSINSTSPTFRPFAVNVSGTTRVDVYAQGGDQMSTTAGTPINIPTSGTSTANQVVIAHVSPDTDLNATWIRVRAKEVTTGTAGTLYVAMTLQS